MVPVSAEPQVIDRPDGPRFAATPSRAPQRGGGDVEQRRGLQPALADSGTAVQGGQQPQLVEQLLAAAGGRPAGRPDVGALRPGACGATCCWSTSAACGRRARTWIRSRWRWPPRRGATRRCWPPVGWSRAVSLSPTRCRPRATGPSSLVDVLLIRWPLSFPIVELTIPELL
jgi:hypothetical protein